MPGDTGYDIFVDGIERTHRDVEAVAYDSALFLKQREPRAKITVYDRVKKTTVEIMEDGRHN